MTMSSLDVQSATGSSTSCPRRRFSETATSNPGIASMLVVVLFFASLTAGLGCSTRQVTPAPAVDGGSGGSGGSAGAAGTPGSGGAGTAGGGGGGDAGNGGGAGGAGPSDASVPDDASVDQVADGAVPADAAVCEGISSAYQAAVNVAQECTVGAENQCTVQVRAGFFCNCTTFTNGDADALASIVAQYQDAGCQQRCIGTCAQVRSLSCLADATSSTGGRCKLPGVLALQAANNGGTFSVPAGEEIDITLESVAPGSYSTNVMLSSTDLATVLEVTIPAGLSDLNGPPRLYRVRFLSAGELQIQIPFESAGPGPSVPAYAVTISAR